MSHKMALPVNAVKLLRLLTQESDDTRTMGKRVAELVRDGAALLHKHGHFGDGCPVQRPAVMLSHHPSPALRPALVVTYLTQAQRRRLQDLAESYKVPHDTALWRSLALGALQHQLGGTDKYTHAAAHAMEVIGDDVIHLLEGDPPPPAPLLGGPRMRSRQHKVAEKTAILRLPMSPRAITVMRAASSQFEHGNISAMVRELLTDALPHIAALTELPHEKRGHLNDNGLSVVLPVSLIERYDALAALISPRARSRLMRHAALTQLHRHLKGSST